METTHRELLSNVSTAVAHISGIVDRNLVALTGHEAFELADNSKGTWFSFSCMTRITRLIWYLEYCIAISVILRTCK